MAHEVSCLVTLKSRLGLEAMMSRLGVEAMMSCLGVGRFGPRSSSGGNRLAAVQTGEQTLEDNKLFSFLKILFATSSTERCVCYRQVH